MENNLNLKEIDGIIYKPSWADTFRNLKVGEEIKLSRMQLIYNTARATCDWVKRKDPSYNFTITACDKFQDHFIVKRIANC